MTTTRTRLTAAVHALHSNELAKAEALVRSRLAEAPDDTEALRLLAMIATRTGHAADAERLLRSAIAHRPGFVLGHADLSSLLCRMGRADEALVLLDHAIASHPTSLWPLSLKSGVLSAERRIEESLHVHAELVARAPDSSVLWMNHAHALKTMGRTEQAVVAYRRSLALDPANGAAWWGLANLRTVPLDANDIRTMEQALPAAGDPFQEVQIRFALGRAFADLGQFQQSFGHYEKANAMRGTLVPYDPRTTRELVVSHEEALAASFFAARHGSGHPADDPIFIVGMPRSGSTLVEQILASHPLVEGTGELFELQDIAAAISGNRTGISLPDAMAGLAPSELEALGQRYLDATRRHRRNGRRHFTDKMPANWRFIALIRLILPNARIVDVRRDPLSCCLSAFSTCFNRESSFPANLHDLARYHRDYIRMMDYGDAVLPGHVLRLHYERLVENPEAEIRRLLDYLGLDFDPSCLRFHENPRPVHTPSAQQVRLPINRSGLDRWRHYEPWLSPLIEGLASGSQGRLQRPPLDSIADP
jgi:tetratricopeptide (TPR) repeat protein